jgi:NADH-quinone oxidoreductase subunit H
VLVKSGALLAVLVLAGRWLPALRPDRIPGLAWLGVLPLTLVQLLVVSVVVVVGGS